ncbi:MAG: hypothetical protein ACSHYB_14290 [Roseibacillus sp.]
MTLLLLIVLVGVLVPTFQTSPQPELIQGINHARTIKSALDLFATDFDGSYPNDETAKVILKLSNPSDTIPQPNTISPPTTSNYYFNQLIGHGLINEELLYIKSFKKTFYLRKPNNDGVVDSGENVWGYTKNLTLKSSQHLPLLYDSPTRTGNHPTFSKKTWNGRIIVVRVDSSTRTELLIGKKSTEGELRGRKNGKLVNLFSQESLQEGIIVPADLKRIGSNKSSTLP